MMGRIRDHGLSIRPICFTHRKLAIVPPVKYIGISTMIISTFLPGR